MSRSKSKIAVALLGALAFGASAQAIGSGVKDVKSGQSLGAVGGVPSENNIARIKKGLSILSKVLIGAGITVGAVVATNETVAGVMWAKNKESDTLLKGKYSFINLIRSKIKKDVGVPGGAGDSNITDNKNKDNLHDSKIESVNENKDEALNIVLKKFEDACAKSSKLFKNVKKVLIQYHCNKASINHRTVNWSGMPFKSVTKRLDTFENFIKYGANSECIAIENVQNSQCTLNIGGYKFLFVTDDEYLTLCYNNKELITLGVLFPASPEEVI